MQQKYCTYILVCADGTFYTGSTSSIDRRITEHNQSKTGAKYTRARRPVKLVYTEFFDSYSKACKREYEIKTLTRAQKYDLIAQSSLNLA